METHPKIIWVPLLVLLSCEGPTYTTLELDPPLNNYLCQKTSTMIMLCCGPPLFHERSNKSYEMQVPILPL